MKRDVLLRIYPRAWRERYGEELREQLGQRPLSVGVVADLLHGAVDAHLHPLRRDANMTRGSKEENEMKLTGPLALALGVLLGVLLAFAVPMVGTPAIILLIPALVWALLNASRLVATSGLLIGVGASTVILLLEASARCAADDRSGPGFVSICTAPDNSVLLVVGALTAWVGGGLAIIASLRRFVRRNEHGATGNA
jgi:hypothetical protein